MHNKPTIKEILDCITRSGYLLESRLVKLLNEAGYFVDPNQVILDGVTGKSREIDLIVEKIPKNKDYSEVCVKTHFVIEAINNLYPLVLTTKRPWSPNIDMEGYLVYRVTPENDSFGDVDIWDEKIPDYDIYSQYCAITRKNNKELMACHTDDLYTSLNKMVQYCNAEDLGWGDRKIQDKYWRIFFWQPVLVLQDDLLALEEKESGFYELKEIQSAKLEFNYHKNEVPSSILIDIVTESYLIQYMNNVVARDGKIERALAEVKYANKST